MRIIKDIDEFYAILGPPHSLTREDFTKVYFIPLNKVKELKAHRRLCLVTNRINTSYMSSELASELIDMLVAIVFYRKEGQSWYRLFIAMRDRYMLWGEYSSLVHLEKSWVITYEFRRVIVEKTGLS